MDKPAALGLAEAGILPPRFDFPQDRGIDVADGVLPPGDFQYPFASAASTICLTFIGSPDSSSTFAAASNPLIAFGFFSPLGGAWPRPGLGRSFRLAAGGLCADFTAEPLGRLDANLLVGVQVGCVPAAVAAYRIDTNVDDLVGYLGGIRAADCGDQQGERRHAPER